MKGCRPLSDEEATAVLGNLKNTRDKALFLLGLKSGFRISELLSLRLGDVFQNGHHVDRVSVARRNMKKKVEGRTVILHKEAKAALEAWICEIFKEGLSDPQTFVFQSRQGKNRSISRISAWHLLNQAYKRAGLTGRLGTHCMRKTFAKKVHEKLGRDLMKTQKALGHASVNSTVSYLSFAQEEIDDAILKS